MGTLYVVATPIGNLGDITNRALEILKEVDLILVEDTRQTIKILNHFNIKNKMVSYHKFNEKQRIEEILLKLKENKNIALVSDAGTPCISDPGYILIKEVLENNIKVIGIPGACALSTAISISGLPSDKFIFIGFLNKNKIKDELEKLKENEINTVVFYESPKRIVKIVKILKEEFKDSNISICSDITKKFERTIYGKTNEVYEKILVDEKIEKGEYTVVFEKNYVKKIDVEIESTIESKIVDVMIKNNITLKEAINYLNDNNKNISKKQIYEASLNLKKIVK
jgi:16S rRNA (cytidine1402-2'-O)-methyltransferase